MNKGKYENMLLAAGYKQESINQMIHLYKKSDPDLSREEVCEAEIEAWSY
jgi:hypothetical protein